MSSLRRSTRTRYAPGTKPKTPLSLPKPPSEEAPEHWPPKNLPPGLVYYPPPPEAPPPKKVRFAPSPLSRGSSAETLACSVSSTTSTLSARSSPGAYAVGDKYAVGRGVDAVDALSSDAESMRASMVRLWDQRRRDHERGVYEKGEPRCEVPLSQARTLLQGGREEEREREGQ